MRILITVCIVVWCMQLHAQFQLGMRLEKNAGIYAININPSNSTHNIKQWDIQLGSAGLFFENNYMFLKETNVGRLLRNRSNLTIVEQKISGRDNVFEVGFSDNGSSRFLHASAFVSGPGIAYQWDKNHSFGFLIQNRAALGISGVPNEFSYPKITKRRHFDPFKVGEFGGVGMNWLELVGNYAWKKEDQLKNIISLGANFKYLIGYDMLFANNLDNYNHAVIGANDFQMDRPQLGFGFTGIDDDIYSRHGRGIGLDFGITYIKNSKNDGYDYKAGISLLDLGAMHFSKDITTYEFVTDSTIRVFGKDFENLVVDDGISGLADAFIANAIGQKPTLTSGNSKRIFLPFSFSAQFDYKLKKGIYLNALLIQPLSLSDFRVRGIHLLSLTPRFEEKWYSFSLPLLLVEKKVFNIGIAARLGVLTLGSDNVLSILHKGSFYGSDIYAGIKIGLGKRPSQRRRSFEDDCYTF